ncbi:MAG: hypothetical protein ACE5FD_07465 [Anaerolineae bacterium]
MALVLVAMFWLLIAPRFAATESPAQTQTAQQAYQQALSVAQNWQPDAQLSRVTASWQPQNKININGLKDGRANWAFTFYSPTTHQTSIIAVNGNQAHQSRFDHPIHPPSLIHLDQWIIDSPVAIQTFLTYGGQEFLQNSPQASIHLKLAVNEQQTVEWQIIGVTNPTNSILFFLNATTGIVGDGTIG